MGLYIYKMIIEEDVYVNVDSERHSFVGIADSYDEAYDRIEQEITFYKKYKSLLDTHLLCKTKKIRYYISDHPLMEKGAVVVKKCQAK